MNKIIITFLFLVGITASSCTTSKSVVSQNVDLSKYEYASIINNDTYHIPAQLMEYEIQLLYLQPIITQYFIDNKSEIWLLFLIAHSKR